MITERKIFIHGDGVWSRYRRALRDTIATQTSAPSSPPAASATTSNGSGERSGVKAW